MATNGYSIVRADDAEDPYAGTDVPGEFRRLTPGLDSEQLAITLIRIPPHSDFEQGTGHFHDEIEELYVVTRGTLTMRFGDDVHEVRAEYGRARRAEDAAVASERGRRAGRDVGDLASARPGGRDEDRRLLGGLTGCRAAPRSGRGLRASGSARAALPRTPRRRASDR